MSTAVQVETCPRCGIQKPFYCACDETVDAEGGLSIYVHGLGVVYVTTEDKPTKPTEYVVALEGQHEFMKTEYRFKAEDARRLAQLILKAADNIE